MAPICAVAEGMSSTIIAATNMTPGVAGYTMIRGFTHPNIVEVYTAAPHGLKVGYQAIISAFLERFQVFA